MRAKAILTDEQIEDIAGRVRRLLRMETLVRPDAFTMIRKARHFGLIKNFSSRMPDHFKSVDAAFDPANGMLYFTWSVFRAANRGDPRARFTIAHEIAHAAVGHEVTRFRRTADLEGRRHATAAIGRDESEANRLAAAILAPYDLSEVDLGTTASDIAERFQISMKAAEIRLGVLQSLYRKRHGIRRELPKAVTDFLMSVDPAQPKK